MNEMSNLSKDTKLSEVFSHFENKLTGKVLTMHFGGDGGDDIVRSSSIDLCSVLEDGRINFLTEDALGQPNVIEFEGDSTLFVDSIYEPNDFWFQYKNDGRLWWGIYDEPLNPASARFRK